MGKKSSIFKTDRNARIFLASILLAGLAYGCYRGVQDNYLAQIVKITKFERGVVEFFRELPGLLLVFILAAMSSFSESKVYKIGTTIMLMGIVGLVFGSSAKTPVILFMVIFSLGEHIVMPVKNSISLHLSGQGKGGSALGIMNSIAQGGNIVGYLAVTCVFFIMDRLHGDAGQLRGFHITYIGGALLLAAALFVGLMLDDRKIKVKRNRIYFNRKFSKFYMLEVFYGARKQVFLTFAPYVLILQYGADTALISMLLAICAFFGMILSPLIGRLIDHIGYKIVMVADTLILIVVCFFYGFSHHLFPKDIAFVVVCVNYVLDSVISLASMAAMVYVQDIADTQEEMTATITTGISVNHLISVFIALLGGLIWQNVGIETLFALAALLGLANSLFAMTIKNPKAKTVA